MLNLYGLHAQPPQIDHEIASQSTKTIQNSMQRKTQNIPNDGTGHVVPRNSYCFTKLILN